MYVVKIFRGGWIEILDIFGSVDDADALADSIDVEGIMYAGWVLVDGGKVLETKTFFCTADFLPIQKNRYGNDQVYRSCVNFLSGS
jgi:hypothetical protein